MSLFRRMADAIDAFQGKTEQRNTILQGASTALGFMPGTSFSNGLPGRLISPATAENLATVLACVNLYGTVASSLPVYVYRRVPGGKEEVPDHHIMRLVRNGVNSHTAWPDYIEWLLAQMLLRGNGLSGIKTDNAGQVVELEPVPWEWCAVQLLASGRLAYDITTYNQLAGGAGRAKRLLEGEVLHFRDRTDDGLIGKSRLQRAAAAIAAGLSVQDFSGKLYDNSAGPSGILTATGKIADDTANRLKTHFETNYSGANLGKVAVLGDGMTWTQTTISPEDAELLASRKFTREENAAIFQVPPPLVGIWDHSSFTNSETAGRWFGQFSLAPVLRKLESEMARSLLTEDDRQELEIVFDLSGLLRGDDQTRWAGHKIAVDAKILTPNEVREVEGYNKRPGGDTFEQTPAGQVVQ